MRKKFSLLGILILALILSGCAANKSGTPEVDVPEIGTQAPALTLPSTAPLPEDIDPSAEEDTDGEYVDPALAQEVAAGASTSSPYAGATPILMDPIDMPTPTKAPPLTFTYATYTANSLGLTFESVAGYTVDETDSYSYVLTEPAATVKDNYPATVTLSIRPVNTGYAAKEIPADLKQTLSDLGKNYQRWEPSNNASRSLMNAQGYYANYRGVMADGTIVRGRVHMALLPGNRLLTLHISNPANFNTDYENVYAQIRKTIKML